MTAAEDVQLNPALPEPDPERVRCLAEVGVPAWRAYQDDARNGYELVSSRLGRPLTMRERALVEAATENDFLLAAHMAAHPS